MSTFKPVEWRPRKYFNWFFLFLATRPVVQDNLQITRAKTIETQNYTIKNIICPGTLAAIVTTAWYSGPIRTLPFHQSEDIVIMSFGSVTIRMCSGVSQWQKNKLYINVFIMFMLVYIKRVTLIIRCPKISRANSNDWLDGNNIWGVTDTTHFRVPLFFSEGGQNSSGLGLKYPPTLLPTRPWYISSKNFETNSLSRKKKVVDVQHEDGGMADLPKVR